MRWVCCLCLAVSVPAASQTTAPPPAVWELDWQAPYCTITTGDPKTLSLSIWSVPGSMTAELYFIGARDRLPPLTQGSARIQLLPSGVTVNGTAFWPKPTPNGLVGVTVYDDPDFLNQLARANQLTVTSGSQTVAMPLRGTAKPMQALNGCMADKLREWGVDPATLSTSKARPTGNLNSWITYNDYPTDALDSSTSGTVVVRLTTDVKGRVANCVALANTGTKSMAQATCHAALRRARYVPVIGPDGQPTAATFITYTTFRVFS